MAHKAEEISLRLLDRQRTRVAEAEARLAEERKKLDLLESLAGDLKSVIEELDAESRGETKSQPAKPLPLVPSGAKARGRAPKSVPIPERSLTSQEILEYVDRFGGGKFTPSKFKDFVEKQIPVQVSLTPLQLTLSRMAKAGKGVHMVSKGGRWHEGVYKALAPS